jgi:hypothetical protein
LPQTTAYPTEGPPSTAPGARATEGSGGDRRPPSAIAAKRLALTLLKAIKQPRYGGERSLTARRLLKSLRPEVQRPVFVIGAPRSGTSFLGQSLAALPSLSYHAEPPATKAAARRVYRGDWPFERARRFYQRVYRWLLRVRLDGDRRLAEKTPRNAFIVPFLARAFPGAQFVHIIRDGRDAALSHSEKPWLAAEANESGGREPGGHRMGAHARFWVEAGREAEFEDEASDFRRCCWAWRRHVEAAREGLAALASARRHTLRYERLARRPRAEADRLAGFLGEHGRLAQHALREAFEEGHARSVGRWRAALTARQRKEAAHEMGALLRDLGYEEGVERSGGRP